MASLWNKASVDYSSSAKVVDGNLIISLPDAINPIVWRMELGSVKASALEVRANADNTFSLTLKTPKGDVHDIAPFAARDIAVRALMRVSAALQGAEGKIMAMPAPANQHAAFHAVPPQQGGSSRKWLMALGVVLALIFLYASFAAKAPDQTGSYSAMDQSGAGDGATEDGAPSGVPLSADQMLRGF